MLEATFPASSSMVKPGASTTRFDVPTIEMVAIVINRWFAGDVTVVTRLAIGVVKVR